MTAQGVTIQPSAVAHTFVSVMLFCWLALWTAVVAAQDTPTAQTVIIVYNPGTPPLKFTDANGSADGLLPDLWRLWSAKTGVAVEFRQAPWDDTLRMIREGEADIHAGLFHTDERDRFLDYSDDLLDVDYLLFHHRNVLGVDSLEDLKGFRIGVPKGYTREFVAKRLPGAPLGVYRDFDALYRAAHEGEVRVFVSPFINYRYNLHRDGAEDQFEYDPGRPLYTRTYRGAVRNGRQDLLELVNRGLALITAEERATLEQKWLGHAQTDTQAVLTIAGSRNLPPFSMLNDDGEPAGIGVDLWRLWSRKTGRAVQFRLTDIARSLSDLKDGRADLHAGLFLSEKRSEWLDFSEPYLRAPATLYHRFKANANPLPADFAESRIGVQGPPPGNLFERYFPGAEPAIYENIKQMIEALERDEIDAFIADRPSTDLELIRSGLRGEVAALDDDLFQVELRAALPRDNPELAKEIEQGLTAITREEMEGILARWLGEATDYGIYLPIQDNLRLTAEEQAWLQNHREFRFAADPDFAPYEYLDKSGHHQGIAADFLKLLQDKLNITFTLVPTDTWDQSVHLAFDKQVDLLPMLNRTPDRESQLLFTDPYFISQRVIITRGKREDIRSGSDLAGIILALPVGYSINDVIRERYPRARIIEVADILGALQRVSEGSADATIVSAGVASHWLERSEITNLRMAGVFGRPSTLSMACRNDLPELCAIVQKGLSSIGEEQRKHIRRRWIALDDGKVDPATGLGLTAEELAWLQQHPVILAGGDSDWPPLDFVDAGGAYRGISADYLELLGGRLGIEFRMVTDIDWSELLERARNREVDLIASISKSLEREQYLTFTYPYFSAPYTIYMRSGGTGLTKGLKDLEGRTVAVEKDYFLHERLSMEFPGIRLQVSPGTQEALEAVAFGHADAYVGNPAVANWLIEQNRLEKVEAVATASILGKSELRLGVRRDWPLLAGALNKALASISPEEHRRIRRRWQGPDLAETGKGLQLNQQEQAWLAAHPNLRLGVDPAWEPIEFMTEDGQYQGIAAEFIQRISTMLGVAMQPLHGLSWEQVLEHSKAAEVDVLPAITPSPERSRYLNFTKPYLHFPFMVFTRRDAPLITGIADLYGKRIVVEKGYVTQEYLERDHPQLKLRFVDTTPQALRALAIGEVDAYVGNLTLGSYLIDKLGLGNIKVAAPTAYANDLSIGVRKDWPELIDILNKALGAIGNDERRAIRQESLAIRYQVEVDYGLLWRVVAGAALLLLLALLWLAQMRRQKAALRHSEERYESAMDAVSETVWEWNLKTGERYFSPGFFHLMGYSNQEIPVNDTQWRDLVHPEDRDVFYEGTEGDAWDSPEAELTLTLEFRIRTPHGHYVYVQSRGGVVERDAQGRPLRRRGSIRDVSEQRQAQEALMTAKAEAEQANRFKSYFLANMSHEIRTPMNAIVGFSHLALQTDLDARQQGYVEKIQASAHALLGVINDILDFSKIEAGKLDIEQTVFSLDEVLENLAHLNIMRAEEKGLELLFDRDLHIPDLLKGDPLRLSQVLTNLVSNAIKFTPRGDVKVRVKLRHRAGERISVDFSVQDSGIGIEPQQVKRLFNAFTQLDGSTTRQYGGSGLGLSISKRLIQLMNGELTVDSRPGRGSRFAFTLPLAVHGDAKERHWIPSPDLRGLRALVVDDNPSARQILGDMLTSFTFEVTTVPNAETALGVLRAAAVDEHRPYKLVLMDWRLPVMNGIDASRRIRLDPELTHRPAVILVTAYGREEVLKQAEEAELDGILIKPVSPSTLFDTVIRALGGTPTGKRESKPERQQPLQRLIGQILLVEDNLINQQLARELLEHLGLQVSTANNGLEALETLREHTFDLVLMDIQMPEMDGYHATRALRTELKLTKLPVVALTAHAMAGEREKCLAAGMNDHLAKPIDPPALYQVLSRWLKAGTENIRTAEPSMTAPQGPDLPTNLPGIDLAWGLERVGGNRQLYAKLLADLLSHHGNAPGELRRYLDDGQRDEARRLAHTLRGVAGNIGAKELQQAAEQLEKELMNAQSGNTEALLANFTDAFTLLTTELTKLELQPTRQSPVADEVKTVTMAERAELIGNLDRLLEDGDPEAKDAARQLREVLAGPEAQALLLRLTEQIESYDFDQAREALSKLSSQLAETPSD